MELDEGDIVSFGDDPMLWVVDKVEAREGKIIAFSIIPLGVSRADHLSDST